VEVLLTNPTPVSELAKEFETYKSEKNVQTKVLKIYQ
jgi:hypothetical protein